MCDALPKVTPEVQRLINMDDEMVFAKDIAPVIHMKPDVIIKYAKDGLWDQDHLGKFVISGDRVKFFRKDFLQKCGFSEKEPETPTERDVILAAINALETILKSQRELIALLEEQNRLLKEGPKTKWAREQGLIF